MTYVKANNNNRLKSQHFHFELMDSLCVLVLGSNSCHLYTSCQLNQHLKDGLCQQLLKLDEVSILGPDASPARGEETGDGDMEQQVRAESKIFTCSTVIRGLNGYKTYLWSLF